MEFTTLKDTVHILRFQPCLQARIVKLNFIAEASQHPLHIIVPDTLCLAEALTGKPYGLRHQKGSFLLISSFAVEASVLRSCIFFLRKKLPCFLR